MGARLTRRSQWKNAQFRISVWRRHGFSETTNACYKLALQRECAKILIAVALGVSDPSPGWHRSRCPPPPSDNNNSDQGAKSRV